MSITNRNFTSKKSAAKRGSISCLLSILLSATALTAPVTFSGTSFGMEAYQKDTEIKATDLFYSMTDNYKNVTTKNENLEFTEINASKLVEEGKVILKDGTKVIANDDYFNPAHQMDFINRIITQNSLKQLPQFNKILELARKNDTSARSPYKIAVSEMIVKTYFQYFYKQFLDNSYLEVAHDVAVSQALSKALFNFSIECEAIQEAIKFEENKAQHEIEEKKKNGDTHISQLKLNLDTEKNNLDMSYQTKIDDIISKIEYANEQLQNEEDLGNKNALLKKIKILENNRKKEIDTKEGLIKNLENNLKNEEIKLKQEILNLEKEKNTKFNSHNGYKYTSYCYKYKLSVIFDGKGTAYGFKTLAQIKNWEPFYRSDSPYWVEFYKIMADHPEIDHDAKINLYDSLLHVLEQHTNDSIEIATFKKWFGISNDDVREVEQIRREAGRITIVDLLSHEPTIIIKESTSSPTTPRIEEYPPLVSPVKNNVSPKQGVIMMESATKVGGSSKITYNTQEKEPVQSATATQEEARVTNEIANQLVDNLTQKKNGRNNRLRDPKK